MRARRGWAWPLVPLYGAALAAKDAVRAVGLNRERRLEWPVISIGSVSAGGAGKTPLTIALANLLSARGWSVDVLLRGYGRAGRGVERVDLAATDPDPGRRFGDEAILIARRTGVPVWVGADRFVAGSAAEQAASDAETPGSAGDSAAGSAGPAPRAHLLDDGMQHRSLARNFDLVVVTAADLEDVLLPAGNLREPLSALRRADAVAVREEELADVKPKLRALMGVDVPLWTVRRALRFPQPLGVFGAGLRPLAFCALARPESFAAMLAKAGCGVVDTIFFPDHHPYSERDVVEIIRLSRQMQATGLVTTEKDAVKLSPGMLRSLEQAVGPVMVVALDAAFVFESPVVRLLTARLQASLRDPMVRDEVRSR